MDDDSSASSSNEQHDRRTFNRSTAKRGGTAAGRRRSRSDILEDDDDLLLESQAQAPVRAKRSTAAAVASPSSSDSDEEESPSASQSSSSSGGSSSSNSDSEEPAFADLGRVIQSLHKSRNQASHFLLVDFVPSPTLAKKDGGKLLLQMKAFFHAERKSLVLPWVDNSGTMVWNPLTQCDEINGGNLAYYSISMLAEPVVTSSTKRIMQDIYAKMKLKFGFSPTGLRLQWLTTKNLANQVETIP